MKRKKNNMIFFCLLFCLFILSGCSYTKVFVGNTVGTSKSYSTTYSVFSGTKTHSLKLEKGDIMNVEIVSEDGTLNLSLQMNEKEPLYAEENVPTDSFSLSIEESGTYELTLTGEDAKGSVKCSLAEDTTETE